MVIDSPSVIIYRNICTSLAKELIKCYLFMHLLKNIARWIDKEKSDIKPTSTFKAWVNVSQNFTNILIDIKKIQIFLMRMRIDIYTTSISYTQHFYMIGQFCVYH